MSENLILEIVKSFKQKECSVGTWRVHLLSMFERGRFTLYMLVYGCNTDEGDGNPDTPTPWQPTLRHVLKENRRRSYPELDSKPQPRKPRPWRRLAPMMTHASQWYSEQRRIWNYVSAISFLLHPYERGIWQRVYYLITFLSYNFFWKFSIVPPFG
jgi:hypothetical protein